MNLSTRHAQQIFLPHLCMWTMLLFYRQLIHSLQYYYTKFYLGNQYNFQTPDRFFQTKYILYRNLKLFHNQKSDICISTTGIAGPTGGSLEKPVGLMYSTIYTKNKHKTYRIQVDSNFS